MCVDHGTYYKFYLKKLKNNSADLSYTDCSLNTNIFNCFQLQKMDEENQINDKLKFSLLPCGLNHTPFFIIKIEHCQIYLLQSVSQSVIVIYNLSLFFFRDLEAARKEYEENKGQMESRAVDTQFINDQVQKYKIELQNLKVLSL